MIAVLMSTVCMLISSFVPGIVADIVSSIMFIGMMIVSVSVSMFLFQ